MRPWGTHTNIPRRATNLCRGACGVRRRRRHLADRWCHVQVNAVAGNYGLNPGGNRWPAARGSQAHARRGRSNTGTRSRGGEWALTQDGRGRGAAQQRLRRAVGSL